MAVEDYAKVDSPEMAAMLAMINAWADGTKPWSFPDVSAAVKKAMLLRMRLLPYLYTAFARYHEDGTPPVRAIALDNGAIPTLILRAVSTSPDW